MIKSRVMEIQLSIKGRPLKTYSISDGSLVAGRDPEADIFLDNVGVSRHHARFERTTEGFFIEDLASANGTYLNDRPVKKALLKDRDVVRISKFSLWISMRPDREETGHGPRQVSPMVFQGTTVLKEEEIEHILKASKGTEEASPFPEVVDDAPAPVHASGSATATRSYVSRTRFIVGITVAFVLGTAAGAGVAWYVLW